jgi:hypothetical protein
VQGYIQIKAHPKQSTLIDHSPNQAHISVSFTIKYKWLNTVYEFKQIGFDWIRFIRVQYGWILTLGLQVTVWPANDTGQT